MRWIRSLLLALLLSLLVGFAIGTWLRLRLERRPVYIGLELGTVPTRPVALLSAQEAAVRFGTAGGRGG